MKNRLPDPIMVEGEEFRVSPRYVNFQVLGQGAYGTVVAAFDKIDKKRIAIKKNRVASINDLELICRRLLRELIILRCLNHTNIVKLLKIQKLFHPTNYNDLYFITEIMETDLGSVIKSEQDLSNDHVRFFMYQILVSLKYLHSAGIVHRDMKPSNILCNRQCDIKLCDFGLSFSENSTQISNETYVVTRWYRPPELLVLRGSMDYHYSTAIDIWSTGCIFAELFNRKPLWRGKSSLDQLCQYFPLLGTPNDNDFPIRLPQDVRDTINRWTIMNRNRFGRGNARDRFSSFLREVGAPRDAIDLLNRMLTYHPSRRITAAEALEHPYFKDIRERELETVAGFSVKFDYEQQLHNVDDIKRKIYEQSLFYNPIHRNLLDRTAVFRNRNPPPPNGINNGMLNPPSYPTQFNVNNNMNNNINGGLVNTNNHVMPRQTEQQFQQQQQQELHQLQQQHDPDINRRDPVFDSEEDEDDEENMITPFSTIGNGDRSPMLDE